MNLRGQDKGRGPKWPKPLSAHLFSRDARPACRDVDSAQTPIGLGNKAGTWMGIAVLQPILGGNL